MENAEGTTETVDVKEPMSMAASNEENTMATAEREESRLTIKVEPNLSTNNIKSETTDEQPLKTPLCEICCGIAARMRISEITEKFISHLMLGDSKSSIHINGDSSQEPDSPMDYCWLCLGILTPTMLNKTMRVLQERFEREMYDADTFNFALTLPPACMVREKIVQLQYIPSSDKPDFGYCFSFKDYCRSCYQTAIERMSSSIDRQITQLSSSDFTVSLTFENSVADLQCDFLELCFPERFPSAGRKKDRQKRRNMDGNNSKWSRTVLMDLLPDLTTGMLIEFDVEKLLHTSSLCTWKVELSRTPLFIGGRYCKYSRYLSQTPWVIDGQRRGDTSIQEIICAPMATFVRSDEVKFTSSGREDIDVRMLGDGRPFVAQFINPRRKRKFTQADIDQLAKEVNLSSKDVHVAKFRVISDSQFDLLKEGEENKRKTYVALCWTPADLQEPELQRRLCSLSTMNTVTLQQKTPIRVLHRRPLAIRPRTVSDMQTAVIDKHNFLLRLTTQAGTYVKEFVHGDFGRTRPSLSNLLGDVSVDIVELDVEHVDMMWPPE